MSGLDVSMLESSSMGVKTLIMMLLWLRLQTLGFILIGGAHF